MIAKSVAVFFVGAFSLAGSAQAALLDRGGGLIYDTDLNLTWLADANYAKTSGYDQYGLFTWSQAQNWIASINSSSLLGFNDWRLPASDNCSVFDCTGSEMGHLFYTEFGFVKDKPNQLHPDNPLVKLFLNIQQSNFYWSGTEAPFTGSKKAWTFNFSNGAQSPDSQQYYYYAWAARDGDVSQVSEPAVLPLTLTGLAALTFAMRKRKAS